MWWSLQCALCTIVYPCVCTCGCNSVRIIGLLVLIGSHSSSCSLLVLPLLLLLSLVILPLVVLPLRDLSLLVALI